MSGHPTLEELLELSLGELAPGAAAPLAEHLRGCPDCFARYASLLELPDPPPGLESEEAAEAAVQAAAWQNLRRVLRLGETGPAAEPAVEPEPRPAVEPELRPAAGRGKARPLVWLGAASLVFAGFLLGYLARGGPPTPGAPDLALATAWSVQLAPVNLATLGEEQEPRKLCPPPGRANSWVLTGLGSAGAGTAYRLKLTRPDGEVERREGDLEPYGEIHLILAGDLPEGEYGIEVRAASGPRGEEANWEYRLTVACP